MHYLADYGIFIAKLLTLLMLGLGFVGAVVMLLSRGKEQHSASKLKIKKINEHYAHIRDSIHGVILSKAQLKKEHKADKKKKKDFDKLSEAKPRLFVIDFDGDIKASAVSALSELITAILLTAQVNDEVLVRLESGGGLVNAYGLAASQLQRLKDAKIKLTVSVDKIAASGGYMMACVADKILAAPFAIIGSIGVIAQLPNFHRFLEKQNIDFEQVTAGEYKRTLTLFGENTEKSRQKLQAEIEDTQELFKAFIQTNRPQVNIDEVATGEHWFAKRAIAFALVDELKTSADYLLAANDHSAIYELCYKTKPSLIKRLGLSIDSLINKVFMGRSQLRGDYL